MVRTVTTKATIEQTHQLGEWFISKGFTPEQVMSWLKSKHYTVNSIHYNAVRVAEFMQGYNACIAKLERITTAKELKAFKAKGV